VGGVLNWDLVGGATDATGLDLEHRGQRLDAGLKDLESIPGWPIRSAAPIAL
jgi:hypothetical protein